MHTYARCILRLATLILAASLGPVPAVRAQQPAATDTVITVELKDVPLTAAIETLCRQAGFNYILDPRVPWQAQSGAPASAGMSRVSLRWENTTAKEALARLLKEQNLLMVENPATTVRRIMLTNTAVSTWDAAWIKGDTNGPILRVHMEDALLDIAITELASKAQLTVVLDPILSSRGPWLGGKIVPPTVVSFRWEKISARQALAALCENYDLVMVEDAKTGMMKIKPAGKANTKPDSGT